MSDKVTPQWIEETILVALRAGHEETLLRAAKALAEQIRRELMELPAVSLNMPAPLEWAPRQEVSIPIASMPTYPPPTVAPVAYPPLNVPGLAPETHIVSVPGMEEERILVVNNARNRKNAGELGKMILNIAREQDTPGEVPSREVAGYEGMEQMLETPWNGNYSSTALTPEILDQEPTEQPPAEKLPQTETAVIRLELAAVLAQGGSLNIDQVMARGNWTKKRAAHEIELAWEKHDRRRKPEAILADVIAHKSPAPSPMRVLPEKRHISDSHKEAIRAYHARRREEKEKLKADKLAGVAPNSHNGVYFPS